MLTINHDLSPRQSLYFVAGEPLYLLEMKKEVLTRKFNRMPLVVHKWAEQARPQNPVRGFQALAAAQHGNNMSYVWLATHAKEGMNDLRYMAALVDGHQFLNRTGCIWTGLTPQNI